MFTTVPSRLMTIEASVKRILERPGTSAACPCTESLQLPVVPAERLAESAGHSGDGTAST